MIGCQIEDPALVYEAKVAGLNAESAVNPTSRVGAASRNSVLNSTAKTIDDELVGASNESMLKRICTVRRASFP